MISEKIKKTLEALDSGTYVNSREVSMGGISFSARDILVKVPLISRLNGYFVGGTGRGKTELAHDILSYFGGSSCYAMGRPDFEPSELLKQIRLGKLKEVETDRELVELTENVKRALFFVDEINRAPPIVQNYFFDFGDGKLVHNGKIINLGTLGYSILLATGNQGNGEYVGISDTDRALKDRMHMIVKLDDPSYRPTPLNMYDVFRGKKNPRAGLPKETFVKLEDIIELNNEFMKREIPTTWPLIGVYLTEGLDYLENVKGNSKLACAGRWPNIKGIRKDTDEDKIMPLSPRAVFSAMGIAGALEMIAESKEKQPDKIKLFVDSLRLCVPFSGVLSESYIANEYEDNIYSAFDSIFGERTRNRNDILEKAQKLEEALAFAEAGKINDPLLDEISPKRDKWAPVREALEGYTERIARNPTEKSIKLKEIIEKAYSGGKP